MGVINTYVCIKNNAFFSLDTENRIKTITEKTGLDSITFEDISIAINFLTQENDGEIILSGQTINALDCN